MRVQALGLVAFVVLAACQAKPEDKEDATAPEAAPLTAASPSSSASQSPGSAACKADETPIFACTFADGKRVAVCGAGEGTGRYRFGADTPELELAGGEYAYAMYSGGGESQIAFDNGNTRYIVFSRMVRTGFGDEGNAPAISDGIVIERAGKFAGMRLCEGELLPTDVNVANAIWEDRGELFTEETMRADPPGNE